MSNSNIRILKDTLTKRVERLKNLSAQNTNPIVANNANRLINNYTPSQIKKMVKQSAIEKAIKNISTLIDEIEIELKRDSAEDMPTEITTQTDYITLLFNNYEKIYNTVDLLTQYNDIENIRHNLSSFVKICDNKSIDFEHFIEFYQNGGKEFDKEKIYDAMHKNRKDRRKYKNLITMLSVLNPDNFESARAGLYNQRYNARAIKSLFEDKMISYNEIIEEDKIDDIDTVDETEVIENVDEINEPEKPDDKLDLDGIIDELENQTPANLYKALFDKFDTLPYDYDKSYNLAKKITIARKDDGVIATGIDYLAYKHNMLTEEEQNAIKTILKSKNLRMISSALRMESLREILLLIAWDKKPTADLPRDIINAYEKAVDENKLEDFIKQYADKEVLDNALKLYADIKGKEKKVYLYNDFIHDNLDEISTFRFQNIQIHQNLMNLKREIRGTNISDYDEYILKRIKTHIKSHMNKK